MLGVALPEIERFLFMRFEHIESVIGFAFAEDFSQRRVFVMHRQELTGSFVAGGRLFGDFGALSRGHRHGSSVAKDCGVIIPRGYAKFKQTDPYSNPPPSMLVRRGR